MRRLNKCIRKLLRLLQHGKQIQQASPTGQRPPLKTPEEWRTYWKAQGQPWRTEPEIDKERQEYLIQQRVLLPDIKHGTYPFKNMEPKLNRADVEWLLAADWKEEKQQTQMGLDLCGADLRGANLSGLPLMRIRGGMGRDEISASELQSHPILHLMFDKKKQDELPATVEQPSVHLEGANLAWANLEGAILGGAHLEGANLDNAQLNWAELPMAHLEGANLSSAQMEHSNLAGAHLEKAFLVSTHLVEAHLYDTHLESARLNNAHLEYSYLLNAHLEGAQLGRAHLEGADLTGAHLEGANLTEVFFDAATRLERVTLGGKEVGVVSLADVHWNDVNLSVVNWSQITRLGDESLMRKKIFMEDTLTSISEGQDTLIPTLFPSQLDRCQRAVRANRQLATVLQAQRLNEDATRFAYRAQVLERRAFWLQITQHRVKFRQRMQALGAWLVSWFLFLLAGYGYRWWRSFLAYLFVISGFATAYYLLGPKVGLPLSCVDAIVFSMTSFHGRGFSPGENIGLSNPLTVLAAIEAFVGLVIEITLIATLTQRFFGK